MKNKVGGNPGIGKVRIDLKHEHIHDIYRAVHFLRRAKIKDIYEFLKKNNKVISIRTIQRCIASDPRIKQDGWYYFINDEARFENRYITPKIYGGYLYDEFMYNLLVQHPWFSGMLHLPKDELMELLDSRVKDMINRFGIFITFTFLEALRPFKDKSMTQRDRNDLVDYWVMNAVPLSKMFMDFRVVLHNFLSPLHMKSQTGPEVSRSEMPDSLIEKVQTIMKNNYPKTYNELANIPENGLDWQAIEQTDSKRYLIRGKTLKSSL